jgi:hypothetical protein
MCRGIEVPLLDLNPIAEPIATPHLDGRVSLGACQQASVRTDRRTTQVCRIRTNVVSAALNKHLASSFNSDIVEENASHSAKIRAGIAALESESEPHIMVSQRSQVNDFRSLPLSPRAMRCIAAKQFDDRPIG